MLRAAVRRRLCGEVPLSCYISGGLDSTVILGLSSQEKGEPIPSFTISLDRSGPSDERSKAEESAHYLGSKLTPVVVKPEDLVNHYPDVIVGAESPVLDTSCVGTLLLARANREAGNTVALTGEGADKRWPATFGSNGIPSSIACTNMAAVSMNCRGTPPSRG